MNTETPDPPSQQTPPTVEHGRRHAVVGSPLGPLRVVVDPGGDLTGVYLPEHSPAPGPATLGELVGPGALRDDADLRAACAAVLALAADPRASASSGADVRLADVPGTPFQRAVWAVVAGIGVGETLTYAQVADAAGHPSAHRAVGRAVAMNPRCLVVPCHRVVGSRGALTGYAGGVALKRWLLAREQELAPATVTSG